MRDKLIEVLIHTAKHDGPENRQMAGDYLDAWLNERLSDPATLDKIADAMAERLSVDRRSMLKIIRK